MNEHKYKVGQELRDSKNCRTVRIEGHYDNANPQAAPELYYEVKEVIDVKATEGSDSYFLGEGSLEPIPTMVDITHRGYDVVKGPGKRWYLVQHGECPSDKTPGFESLKAVLSACCLWGDGTVRIDRRAAPERQQA